MHNPCKANLKRIFWDICSHQLPTGDPTCPPYIVSAKRIQQWIDERSDADNLDGEEADIGFDNSNIKANDGDGAVVQAEEGGNEPNVQCRLFENNVPVARPLMRTPSSVSRASQHNDILSIALNCIQNVTKFVPFFGGKGHIFHKSRSKFTR
jgi:hypothetical protein